MECVRHLDGLIAIHMMRNSKEVEKQRKHAKKDMMKRVKKQDKIFQSRENAYEKKIAQETRARSKSEINGRKGTWTGNGTTKSQYHNEKAFSELIGSTSELDLSDGKSVKSYSSGTFQSGTKSLRMISALRSKFNSLQSSDKEPRILRQRSLDDSGLFEDMSSRSPSLLDQLELKAAENQQENLVLDSTDPYEVDESDLAFGHVVKKFDDKGNVTTHVHYVPKNSVKLRNGSVASRTSNSSSHLSSSFNDIRSLKSIELEDTYSQSDMGAESTDSKSLVTFMAALNLDQFSTLLINESIDLNTLTLCSDDDLKDIGLPLGPRRKILDAVKKRNEALNHPGPMIDSKI